MKNLNNGIAVYKKNDNGLIDVYAFFRGKIEIVFQSYDRKDVVTYCHEHGMRVVSFKMYNDNVNASFRKINAKHKFNESEWIIGIV